MSNYDAALDAFSSNLPAGESENQPTGDVNQVTPPQVQPRGSDATSGTDQSLLEQAKIDLSGLPEDQQIYLRQREREMQSHMTKRIQEATEARREAEQAQQFLQQLNSDPTFAMGVFTQLQQNLAAAGILQGGSADPNEYAYDEYGNPIEQQGPDPYEQKIAQLEGQWEAMQQQMLEQRLAADLDAQLSSIRSSHPDWGDNELQAVIDLGFATNGNLIQAASQFEALNDSVISRYIEKNGTVNTPAPLPTGPGGTSVPKPLKTDEQLRAAAMERIRAELG